MGEGAKKKLDSEAIGKDFKKAAQSAAKAFRNLADAMEFAKVRLKIESLTKEEKAYVRKELEKTLGKLEEEE